MGGKANLGGKFMVDPAMGAFGIDIRCTD